MNYILFDDYSRIDLLPFTFTRPVCEIRSGILTIREKWEKFLTSKTSTITEKYLSQKFPIIFEEDNFFINGKICPDQNLILKIGELKSGQKLMQENTLIAFRLKGKNNESLNFENFNQQISFFEKIKYSYNFLSINFIWDIFKLNDELITRDYFLLTKERKSAKISESNSILGNEIFVEEGASAECAIINTKTGPVYLGKNSVIMEGSMIRGPFALCEESTLKMGAKIYGPTTVGPYSKIGGEINKFVIFGYSNKAHDGFLGNSVIGEWCNLGADTNNSNLKNNYAEVKIWSYKSNSFVNSGLTFCGLFMGDHSKCGINTMFNTGTVVGVSANIFGDGFPRNFIPSFSWGGAAGFTSFTLVKALEVAEKVMSRRSITLNPSEKEILEYLFNNSISQSKKG